jgi:hypothetical protein
VDTRDYVTQLISASIDHGGCSARSELQTLLEDSGYRGQAIRPVFIEEILLYEEAFLRDLTCGADHPSSFAFLNDLVSTATPCCAHELSPKQGERLIRCIEGYLNFLSQLEEWNGGASQLFQHVADLTHQLLLPRKTEETAHDVFQVTGTAFLKLFCEFGEAPSEEIPQAQRIESLALASVLLNPEMPREKLDIEALMQSFQRDSYATERCFVDLVLTLEERFLAQMRSGDAPSDAFRDLSLLVAQMDSSSASALLASQQSRTETQILGMVQYVLEQSPISREEVIYLTHALELAHATSECATALTAGYRRNLGKIFLPVLNTVTDLSEYESVNRDLWATLSYLVSTISEFDTPQRGKVLRAAEESIHSSLNEFADDELDAEDFIASPVTMFNRLVDAARETAAMEALDEEDATDDERSPTEEDTPVYIEQNPLDYSESPESSESWDSGMNITHLVLFQREIVRALLHCPSVLNDRDFWQKAVSEECVYHPAYPLFVQGTALSSPESVGDLLLSLMLMVQTKEASLPALAALVDLEPKLREMGRFSLGGCYRDALKHLSENSEVQELCAQFADTPSLSFNSKDAKLFIDENIKQTMSERLSKAEWDAIAFTSGGTYSAHEMKSFVRHLCKQLWPKSRWPK